MTTSMIPAWIRAWWPAVLWAVIISYASTDAYSSQETGEILTPILRSLFPAITQSALAAFNFFLRKSAHCLEYFIFYLLVYRGISGGHVRWHWRWGVGAWLIVTIYSLIDEFHQSFIPSRTASPWDSMLDSVAAGTALVGSYVWLRVRQPEPVRLRHDPDILLTESGSDRPSVR